MNKAHNPLPFLLLTGLCFLPVVAAGLPDDADQPFIISASSNEIMFDQGIAIYYGDENQPAEISQGSLRIRGQQITVERSDGILQSVTASGSPARFQQQPALDQAVVHGSGENLSYDNVRRLVAIEGNAELSQAGNIITGERIEYDIAARRASAQGGDNEPLRMVIPPNTSLGN